MLLSILNYYDQITTSNKGFDKSYSQKMMKREKKKKIIIFFLAYFGKNFFKRIKFYMEIIAYNKQMTVYAYLNCYLESEFLTKGWICEKLNFE